jgi:hypothetical protein
MTVLLALTARTSAKYKVKYHNNVKYYVCPTVMLREGVFTANGGPVLYRKKELHTFQEAWNNKPIVLEHPVDENGDFTTATTPEILEKTQIGFILNSRWDDKLKADAWIDVERTRKIAPTVLANIEKGIPNEVSTGLVVDQLEKEGKFAEKKYTSIATSYRPDHLAVLVGKKGACSLADGGGLLVMQEHIPLEMKEYATVVLDKLLTNQLTHNRLREVLSKSLVDWAILNKKGYLWIEDVAPDFVVFRNEGKMWRLGYKKVGDSVKFDGKDPVEIESVLQYRLVDGTVIANNSTETEKDEPMKKKQMVEFLIANGSATGWEESDRETLTGMEDTKLSKLVKAQQKKAVVANEGDDDDDDDDDGDDDTEKPVKKPAKKPAKRKSISNEETDGEDDDEPAPFDYKKWMKQAPKEVRMGIQHATRLMNQQLAADMEQVVELSEGDFTEEDCQKMNPTALNKLARTLANAAAKNKSKKSKTVEEDEDDDEDDDDFDFSGASGFILGNNLTGSRRKARMTANEDGDDEDDAPLGLAKPTYSPSK